MAPDKFLCSLPIIYCFSLYFYFFSLYLLSLLLFLVFPLGWDGYNSSLGVEEHMKTIVQVLPFSYNKPTRYIRSWHRSKNSFIKQKMNYTHVLAHPFSKTFNICFPNKIHAFKNDFIELKYHTCCNIIISWYLRKISMFRIDTSLSDHSHQRLFIKMNNGDSWEILY